MLLVTGVVGCPQTRPVDGPTPQPSSGAGGPEAPDPMALRYDAAVFAGHEPLVERLRSSDFAYFRYLAAPFAKLVCEELTEEIAHMPTVNLHGDLHLEQYAIADDGFGIVDFDDATKGPPILDWLRFATSIWLATDDADTAEYAIARFIDGYRAGLAEPNAVVKASEPAAAKAHPRALQDHPRRSGSTRSRASSNRSTPASARRWSALDRSTSPPCDSRTPTSPRPSSR
ncbi:MAG: DUF2252 family protein [Polyangiaceae bacterium]|nr:DUF2252 family protein [Polyangiaceae bacterium]